MEMFDRCGDIIIGVAFWGVVGAAPYRSGMLAVSQRGEIHLYVGRGRRLDDPKNKHF